MRDVHSKAHLATAERAEDALASYLKNRADLVLTEVRLPGTNGIELLKRLREGAAT